MSHKTVWITGASSGIGREFACRYAKLGFRLILTARRRERLDQLAAELLAKYNTFCRVLPADLARESECTRLCEELAEERIDIFINNAGFGVCGSFLETSTEAELSMAKVNVLAMHQLCKFAVQKMQAQGFGTVLNVASSAGLLPGGPYMAGYYATKAYVVSLPRPGGHRVQRPGGCGVRPQGHFPRPLCGGSHARDAAGQDHHRALGPDAGCHHRPALCAHAAAHAHYGPTAEKETGRQHPRTGTLTPPGNHVTLEHRRTAFDCANRPNGGILK